MMWNWLVSEAKVVRPSFQATARRRTQVATSHVDVVQQRRRHLFGTQVPNFDAVGQSPPITGNYS